MIFVSGMCASRSRAIVSSPCTVSATPTTRNSNRPASYSLSGGTRQTASPVALSNQVSARPSTMTSTSVLLRASRNATRESSEASNRSPRSRYQRAFSGSSFSPNAQRTCCATATGVSSRRRKRLSSPFGSNAVSNPLSASHCEKRAAKQLPIASTRVSGAINGAAGNHPSSNSWGPGSSIAARVGTRVARRRCTSASTFLSCSRGGRTFHIQSGPRDSAPLLTQRFYDSRGRVPQDAWLHTS